MPISVHQASIPLFEQMLESLSAVLEKAKVYCAETKTVPAEFLELRLAPDMFTLTQQVQRACGHAGGSAARLAGIEVPVEADDEAGFEDLHARIERTRGFLAGLTAEQLAASESRAIEQPTRIGTLTFASGPEYLFHFAIPQFMFHATTAYGIIRHAGVQIGKVDYMGSALR